MEPLAPKREIRAPVVVQSEDRTKVKHGVAEVMLVPSWTLPSPLPLAVSPTCPRHGPTLRMALHGGTLLDGLSDDCRTIKLAFTLGLCKLLCGTVIVVLGLAALVLQATLGGIGGGMWAGMVALVSGIVGMLSSRLPHNYAVLVAFLCWSITSLATSALLVVFSTTGLTKDLAVVHDPIFGRTASDPLANSTDADYFTIETASFPEPLFLSVFPTRRAASIANATLVTLALVDCLLSIACISLVSSETCTRDDDKDGTWGVRAERKTRRDRLLNWLDQQHIRLFMQHCTPNCQKPTVSPVLECTSGCQVLGSIRARSNSSPTPCQSCISRDTVDTAVTTKSILERRITPSRNVDRTLTTVQRAPANLGLDYILAEDLIATSYSQDRY